MKVEKSIIWGHHLPLSRDPIQPVQPLIINVSTGDRKKKKLAGPYLEDKNLSRSLPFLQSFFLIPFLFLSFPSPPPVLCMSQVNSVQFKGSLLAWPALWWSASSVRGNAMMEHQQTTGISAPLHKHTPQVKDDRCRDDKISVCASDRFEHVICYNPGSRTLTQWNYIIKPKVTARALSPTYVSPTLTGRYIVCFMD